MEELKMLVELINTLPTLAVWVLVLFFCYKIIVIGSVYGLIRFGVEKLHSWLTSPKAVTYNLGQGVITDALPNLIAQLSRLKDAGHSYLHESDIAWLAKAIDAQEAADMAAKK